MPCARVGVSDVLRPAWPQLADWWLNTAYLEYRSPVVVWSSPGLVMPLQEWDTQQQQLKYAARLVSDAMTFKELLDG